VDEDKSKDLSQTCLKLHSLFGPRYEFDDIGKMLVWCLVVQVHRFQVKTGFKLQHIIVQLSFSF